MSPSSSAHVDTFCRDHLPAEEEWPELIGPRYPSRLNCAVELLDEVADRVGAGRTCLLAPGSAPWTYGELRRVSNQIARVLVEDHGIVPGNRVLLRGPNNPWLVACWFGVLKAGAVAVTTVPMLRAAELATIAEIAAVDFALCDARFTDALRSSGVPGLRVVEYGGGTGLNSAIGTKPAAFTPIDTAADDVALLAFTSGTTGRPKATAHFHRDVLAITDTFSAHVLKPDAADVFTGTPPLAFTFGLGGLVVFPLRAGASTLLIEKATPDQLADLIAEHTVSVCFTAPTAYRAMVPGYVAAVVDERGNVQPFGTPGRLAVKGPTGCRYLADARQRAYVQNGWNITGDTFVQDADGYFWYQARDDDMIVSSGYNIAAPEVEEALLAHPDVRECGVTGLPDEARGQLVTAFVVLRGGINGAAETATQLQNFVKARIAPYKYPRRVVFVSELPKTATGKLQRYRLRELIPDPAAET